MEESIKRNAVVDASFILSFLLPDEFSTSTEELFDQFEKGEIFFISSQLLPYEIFNSLRSATIRKRITQQTAQQLCDKFIELYIPLIPLEYSEVFSLALKKDITFYDASYVYLAKAHNMPLLTLDKTLQKI